MKLYTRYHGTTYGVIRVFMYHVCMMYSMHIMMIPHFSSSPCNLQKAVVTQQAANEKRSLGGRVQTSTTWSYAHRGSATSQYAGENNGTTVYRAAVYHPVSRPTKYHVPGTYYDPWYIHTYYLVHPKNQDTKKGKKERKVKEKAREEKTKKEKEKWNKKVLILITRSGCRLWRFIG